MPVLRPPADAVHVTLPPRRARYAARTQVLVVGGGPAGLGAALGAAAAGARVVLAERYGFLGGNATAALVMPLMSFHNEKRQQAPGDDTRLLPTDHGEGDPMVGECCGGCWNGSPPAAAPSPRRCGPATRCRSTRSCSSWSPWT
ncbi:FAD-dependent oxidoreductase [Thermomonospora amylolytica]|uniref:FAD-dependent oxidoreductase n=1 Tax=Thermomonospora amylolytica TaxID=1411117 RepID=UPI0018E51AB9|nr:FAD-dependent oxidoreductase [Thermomonospora amylolytica]